MRGDQCLAFDIGPDDVDRAFEHRLLRAYDAAGGAYAARLWWLLRYFGHERVSVLDGGWTAWQAAGGPTESASPPIAPATFVAVPHPDMVVDAAAAYGRSEVVGRGAACWAGLEAASRAPAIVSVSSAIVR